MVSASTRYLISSPKRNLGNQDRIDRMVQSSLGSPVEVMLSTVPTNEVSMSERRKSGKTVDRKHTSADDTVETATKVIMYGIGIMFVISFYAAWEYGAYIS